MKIPIPFLSQFKESMLNGTKTWTSRTKIMGEVGDTFDVFGQTFEITALYKMSLKDVKYYWKREGCKSQEDFILVWNKIHPRKKFDPEQAVWVHQFKEKTK